MLSKEEGQKKVAIYVRVSVDKRDVKNQLIELREFCKKKGWAIYKEYVDVISGAKTSRPAFDEMFRDAHQLKFDIVLVWALDRFSRAGLEHTILKLKELNNLGISFYSYTEPYLNTTDEITRNVMLALLSSIAKWERKKISERTKAGLKRAIREGKKIGRPSISDYKRRKIIKLRKEGFSYSQIARLVGVSKATISKVLDTYAFKKGVSEKSDIVGES